MELEYPPSPRQDLVEELHGFSIADPYRWLEDLDSPQTRDWIAAQNHLTAEYLARLPARERIRQRIAELWDYEKFGVPSRRGNRYFFTRNDGLQNQAVLYWMEGLEDPPRLLLDPNLLSEDGTVALMQTRVSLDGRLLAYGLSSAGSDWVEWRVREVETGRDWPDVIQWSKFSDAAWSHDHAGFYYSRYDAPAEGLAYKGANYFQKLYYHRLGAPQAEDLLVYARPDEKEWGFHGTVTEDGRYLVIHVWKGTHRENAVFFRDLEIENGPVVELLRDWDASYALVGNDGPIFYFYTDLGAPNARVIAVDVTRPERAHWRAVLPEGADALQDASLVGGVLTALYLHDAHSQVKLFDKEGHFLREVLLPEMGTVAGFGGRQDERETFYSLTGFTVPGTIYRYDYDTGTSTVFREPQVRFAPDDFATEQVFYPSKDGTRVPMFLSYRKGMRRNGDNPTYLYGYGGFNVPMTPLFSVANLVWMERGGLIAWTNLRGGSEYGKAWHEAGRLAQKQNVFDDFIAAAEWLLANGYTRPARLGIVGGSNGGLLVGACLTQRPDLFGAAVPIVGVLDMLRFHKFTIGWAWVSDYGSPDDPAGFRTLLAYSPYHNIRTGVRYPPTLVVTGDHDDRVFPAHSFKFAAALQHAAAETGAGGPVLIRLETRAGHGLGKPTTKLIEEAADIRAFLWQALGMQAQEPA